MTDKQIVDTLILCNGDDCTDCPYKNYRDCVSRLRTEAACRLDALSRAVEQKNDVSQETGNSQEKMTESNVQLEPERATEYISIPVAEYQWLSKVEAMLDLILADTTYSHENVVEAVRNAVHDTYRAAEGCGKA